MRADGAPEGLRQSMSWLHTWAGLVVGWLLYAVFLMGTLSYVQSEITLWMKPELHRSVADEGTLTRAVRRMEALASGARSWTIGLPGGRETAVRVFWREPDTPQGRAATQRALLDAGTGEVLEARETQGAGFFYRFHFQLYGMPWIWGRWIVSIATMIMLIAIVSGVITHKKIFKDFFTFRRGKGQRSWLDAHNATGVFALPFHLMITYSGLLLFMNLLMPWGVDFAYRGDRDTYFAEASGRLTSGAAGTRQAGAGTAARVEGGRGGGGFHGDRDDGNSHVATVPLEPLIARVTALWKADGIDSVSINGRGTPEATVEFRRRGGGSLVDRGASDLLIFSAVTGELQPPPQTPPLTAARATYNVLTSLHLGRVAGPTMRWLLFLSGLAGTLMVATGVVLWVVKRAPDRRRLGRTPLGHRLVEVLNVAAVAGLPVAIAAYFFLNRLVPAGLADRADWEVRGFFIAWLLCFIHPLFRSYRQAWVEQLWAGAMLLALLPLLNALTGGSSLFSALVSGPRAVAAFDLVALAAGALLALGALRTSRHSMGARKEMRRHSVPSEARPA